VGDGLVCCASGGEEGWAGEEHDYTQNALGVVEIVKEIPVNGILNYQKHPNPYKL
jgi:hypothetical protein